MPQVFIVVRCFSCDTFQVQQSKKSPKWSCKMCGQKQSLKKVYGKGNGADCRKLVQSLNLTAGELVENRTTSSDIQLEEYESSQKEEVVRDCSTVTSRWSNFLEQPQERELEDTYSDGEEEPFSVVTERPLPVKRRNNVTSFNKKQRFQKQNTKWESYTSTENTDNDSEKRYEEEIPSLSSSRSYFTEKHDFSEETDSLSPFRNNFFARTNDESRPSRFEKETDRSPASELTFKTNFNESILQEKFPQQSNASISRQCLPLKRKRKYEAELPKENSEKPKGNNSKWNMFLTAEVDNSVDEGEEHLDQNYLASEWIETDSTIRPNEHSKPKIF